MPPGNIPGGQTPDTQNIDGVLARVRELVTRFNPIDCLWYDGWWPFTAERWRAREMNDMARGIQPHILFNGRNGLPGDFGTPEQHLAAPSPWRPWEACVTTNGTWGYHAGDCDWKPPWLYLSGGVRVPNAPHPPYDPCPSDLPG